jgi:hypothetical protein
MITLAVGEVAEVASDRLARLPSTTLWLVEYGKIPLTESLVAWFNGTLTSWVTYGEVAADTVDTAINPNPMAKAKLPMMERWRR